MSKKNVGKKILSKKILVKNMLVIIKLSKQILSNTSDQFRSEYKHPLKLDFRWGQFYQVNLSDNLLHFYNLYFQGVNIVYVFFFVVKIRGEEVGVS